MFLFRTLRLGRLFGFPIELNVSFLVLLGLVLLTSASWTGAAAVLIAFVSVILHELGHALVSRRLGVPILGIELHFFGGAAKMAGTPNSARDEVLIAAAGPGVSAALGAAALGLGLLLDVPFVRLVGYVNLLLAGFNLLPALPMDGGRILRAALAPRLGYTRATDVAVIASRVVAVGIAVLGALTRGYFIIGIAIFLWFLASRERRMARAFGYGFRPPFAAGAPGEGADVRVYRAEEVPWILRDAERPPGAGGDGRGIEAGGEPAPGAEGAGPGRLVIRTPDGGIIIIERR